jgi:DNA polymerase elongation subunit (family B)
MNLPREVLNLRLEDRGEKVYLIWADKKGVVRTMLSPVDPWFYIPRKQVNDAKPYLMEFGASVENIDAMDTMGRAVVKVTVPTIERREKLAVKLETKGIEPLESDVSPEKHLMTEYEIKQCKLEDIAYLDIEVEALEEFPEPAVAKHRLLSIAVVGKGEDFISKEDERKMYEELEEVLSKYQVVIGWNWVKFDMAYLLKRAENLGVQFHIFPRQWADLLWIYQRINTLMKVGGTGKVALDEVAEELLGVKKKRLRTVKDFEELYQSFLGDKKVLREYNLGDARILKMLNEKYKFLEPFIYICTTFPGLFLSDMMQMSVVWETIMLWKARKQAIPIVFLNKKRKVEKLIGGYVKEQVPGVFGAALGLDFYSMYPSILEAFLLSPETIDLYLAWKESGEVMEEWIGKLPLT